MSDIENEYIQKILIAQLLEKDRVIAERDKTIFELNKDLNNYKGKVEIYSQVCSDFKIPNRPDIILNDKQSSEVLNGNIPLGGIGSNIAPTYEILRGEYFNTGNSKYLKLLFEDYGKKPSEVLIDIRNKLPKNINYLVKQYNLKKEYEIIKKSKSNIKKFTKETNLSKLDLNGLDIKYINNYNNENKATALLFLKQALIYYPFQFDDFLYTIREYWYNDLDQYIENLKIEFYGENNILLKNFNNNVEKIKNNKKPHNRIDYKNPSVSELVELVKNIKYSKKDKADRIYKGMKKAKRTEDECLLFKEEVNKILSSIKKKNNNTKEDNKEEDGKKHINYKSVSIPELVELVKNIKNNPNQKALRIFNSMKKKKRTEDECLLFKEEVNKILHKKI